MKKFYLWIAAAIFIWVGIVLFFQNGGGVTNAHSKNSGVVAFGDSLTYGKGSKIGGGYVETLSEDLNIEIANLGIVGNTTQDALNRIGEVEKLKPKVTIVLLGGNDLLQGVPTQATFNNLSAIIEKLHKAGSAVILVGLESGINSKEQRANFDMLAKTYKTAYVPDILQGIFGNKELMADALHPNDAGYRIMADRIRPELEKLLR
jgi:acyl-CoA thioesterase I